MNRIAWIGMAAALVAFACELPLETEQMAPPGEVLAARQGGPPGARGAAHVHLDLKGESSFDVAFAAVDAGEGGVQGHLTYRTTMSGKGGDETVHLRGRVVCLELDRRVKGGGAAWIGARIDRETDRKVIKRRDVAFRVRDGGQGPDAMDHVSGPTPTKIFIDTKDGSVRCSFPFKAVMHPIDRGNIQVTGGRGVIKK